MNKLILGDNLEILKTLESESVDLIYLDPPFFSNRNYEVIWGDKGEVRSFEDRFSGGVDHYIAWLKDRVMEMHRILKRTGTVFLHCDWHANAYIRVHILDRVFGGQNFVNEITWKRTTTHNDTKQGAKHFGRITDTIYFYAKDHEQYIFHPPLEEIFDTSIDELWFNCKFRNKAERVGYPTQKPEALLERIIVSVTNEDDVVLDPFLGSGTTIAVAERLKRKWIGIDQSIQAIKLTENRIKQLATTFETYA